MRRLVSGVLIGGLCVGAVYVFNASRFVASRPDATIRFIAHRGVHQTFDLSGVTTDTCTASRIREPIVPEIENTLPSIQAAFAAGADVVEIDVHPTIDGQFAVFHDWTLECRTNGAGVVRDHTMADLRQLDVGYGYTADGGKTFPLRGQGVGLMPSLEDVLTALPDGHFFVNFKSNEAREGDMLAALLKAHPEWRRAIWGVYGGGAPTDRAISLIDGLEGYSMASVKNCLVPYLALGWSGYVPEACRETMVPIPINVAPWLWGWPHRLQTRFDAVHSTIVLFGPYRRGDAGSSGIDTPEQFALVPPGFDGYVSTNTIDAIAPLRAAR